MSKYDDLKRDDYLEALTRVHEDKEDYEKIESLINMHFDMIRHLKETSLYDILEYENRLTKTFTEPFKLVSDQNNELKKEINDLRKNKGLVKKYKIIGEKDE